MQYSGHLSHSDPLFGFLKYDIQPRIGGGNECKTDYRVFKLNGSNDVYLYEEKYSGTKMIGKFFLSARTHDREYAARKMEREFCHLEAMRDRGFAASPLYIARPLGRNAWLNQLLVVEYCNGELFSSLLFRAIRDHDDPVLFSKLTALAFFFSSFHNHTAEPGTRIDFDADRRYAHGLLDTLRNRAQLDNQQARELDDLLSSWRDYPPMYEDCRVSVHGDATPENFLLGDGPHVIGFDLERLHADDRVFDLGRMAGELAHFFMMGTGTRLKAEPFIGHFLWEYCTHFPDRHRAFESVTRRVPFYMGITLLRIARNSYLSWDYRKKLIGEAFACLKGRKA